MESLEHCMTYDATQSFLFDVLLSSPNRSHVKVIWLCLTTPDPVSTVPRWWRHHAAVVLLGDDGDLLLLLVKVGFWRDGNDDNAQWRGNTVLTHLRVQTLACTTSATSVTTTCLWWDAIERIAIHRLMLMVLLLLLLLLSAQAWSSLLL